MPNILGLANISENWKCKSCGCSNKNRCPGGCYFVEKDFCSKCASTIGRQDKGMRMVNKNTEPEAK